MYSPACRESADGVGVVSHVRARLLADLADRTTLTAQLSGVFGSRTAPQTVHDPGRVLVKAEPKTLRYRILHVAARLARGGRRLRLKIDRSWRWARVLAQAFQRLHALPVPAT